MRSVWLLFAIVLVGLYVLIRIDLIPDMLPIVGWLDDTFLVGLLLYYFRYKKLPGFILALGRMLFKQRTGETGAGRRDRQDSQEKQTRTGEERDPYSVLGLKPGAGRKEIQAAYREAVQKYHPDKVSHLGEEFQKLAQQKFIEIQKAYDQLMRREE